MNHKIAILRGINVGGKRKILMADLKSMCENLGLKNVRSYIQSGNLIFKSDRSNPELESDLEKAIAETFNFDVPVIVRTEQELRMSIQNNPFYTSDSDIKQLHLTFLKATPNIEHVEKILSLSVGSDTYKIHDKDVFIFCVGKYHQSKLTNNFFEKNLKVGATTRNWKTVLTLLDLSKNNN